jgi:polyisoprenoid-binding protein YceI
VAVADTITMKLLPVYSRATFKTDAPLETIVGNTAGDSVSGTLSVDPAKPQAATGTVKVDLKAVKTGVDKRDADMLAKDFLDADASDANRYAVFELKGVEIAGPLQNNKDMPAKVKGVLIIKGKPVEVNADAVVRYVKLTPDLLTDAQKKFGFTSDNLKVRARFGTAFNNHGMQVPQLLFLKVSNDIQVETDLTFVRQ